MSFSKPLYPFVHPSVLVETFENGESVSRFMDGIEGNARMKKDLAHIGTYAFLKMLLVCVHFFKKILSFLLFSLSGSVCVRSSVLHIVHNLLIKHSPYFCRRTILFMRICTLGTFLSV